MAQFDVYARRNGPGYVLDCQSNVLERLNTRFVVPLLPVGSAPGALGHLNPVFEIQGASFVLMPQNAATVPIRELVATVTSLEAQRYAVLNALDVLITGY